MKKNSMHDAPLLFALAHSHVLGEAVARQMGLVLASHEERVFEDGEHKARPLQSVRGRHCVVLHSLFGEPAQTVNDKLNRLLFFIATLKDAAAEKVTAVVPYLAYARKDRKTQPRDPVTLRYVAQLFEAVSTDALMVMEVHNSAALQNAFRCQTELLDSAGLFVAHLQPRFGELPLAVVSPDAGGVKRAALFRQRLAQRLGQEVTMGYVEKFRSGGALSGELLVGEVSGRQVLLFDDLISSGQTMLRAAKACQQHGAVSVWACAAHGLFNANAATVFSDPAIARVFTTDSVQLPSNTVSAFTEKLETISCVPLLAEAIWRCHAGGSLVELMQE